MRKPSRIEETGCTASRHLPAYPLQRVPTPLLDTLNEHGWCLSHSPPPYAEELPLPGASRRPRKYSLLILDVLGAEVARVDLQHAIATLRHDFAMPCFVRFAPAANVAARGLRAAVIGAGGEVLPATEAIGKRALYVLTQRRDLASDWVAWLRLRRELGHREESVIRALLNHSDGFRTSTEALQAAEISDRTARYWLASAGLPAPAAWFCANRILRALLRLQRDSKLKVHEIALQLGYSGSNTFSNQMFRYFEHGADKGRRLLGLEPRFHAFETAPAVRRS